MNLNSQLVRGDESSQASHSTHVEQQGSRDNSSAEDQPPEAPVQAPWQENAEHSDTSSLNSGDNELDDDPFHDERADSADEVWVMQNLLQGFPSSPSASSSKNTTHCDDNNCDEFGTTGLPTGSQIEGEETISCPCCFSTVSLQAQPHVWFQGQFRALFVLNCVVLHTSRATIHYPMPMAPRNDNTNQDNIIPHGPSKSKRDKEIVDVACSQCGTLVGVLDKDQVYHFCNVIC